ncbi:MAG: tetratricopeptide repeat protein [Blastocatellia bacterium]
MQKQNLLFGLVGIILGVAVGYFATQSINKNTATASNEAAAPMGAQPQMPPVVLEMLKKANDEPDNFDAQMQVAALYQQIGRPEKMIEFLKRAVKLKPTNVEALQNLTSALLETGNKAEAETTLKQLEKADPKNPALAELKKQLSGK